MQGFGQVPLLMLGIFFRLPKPAVMQTDPTTSVSNIIDYSVALNVMISIAVVYSVVTLFCCFLVVLNCVKNTSKVKEERTTPYKHIMPSRLDTILEETETSSKYSSQSSLSKRHKMDALTIANKKAVEALASDTRTTETVMNGDFDKDPSGSSLFVNRSALELEHGEATEKDLEKGEFPERSTAITTSFRKMTPLGKLGGGHAETQPMEPKPSGSPLTRYSPRGSSISPADVKVPFSDSEPESSSSNRTADDGHTEPPGPGSVPTKSAPNSPSRSPFGRTKHPKNEIPSTSVQITSEDRISKHSPKTRSKRTGKVTPFPPSIATVSIATVSSQSQPPTGRNSPQLMRRPGRMSPQDATGKTNSPQVRSRPHTKSALSQSPYVTRNTKASVPGQGISSAGNETGNASRSSSVTSTSSSSSTLTADILLKKLKPVSKKWYIIGRKLDFPNRKLSTILNENNHHPDKCLAVFCEEWISSSKDASWAMVVEALRSELVDEKELAGTLEQQHCWTEGQNSKTWL